MRLKILTFGLALATMAATSTSCAKNAKNENMTESSEVKAPIGGPRLGEKPSGGFRIDKSGDAVLQKMIADVLPKFKQYSYKDKETGITIRYNLFSPFTPQQGRRYPLVMFIADASTPGDDITLPLSQGYGGLIWATDEWQKDHPCYVLVPQFSGVAVDDAYEHTAESDAVIRMLKEVADSQSVDTNRIYTTGQSMGGMLSMYYNVTYPDLFAASIFVDSHWNTATFPDLARHTFVWFIAGDSGKAFAQIKPFEEAAKKDGVRYAFAEWSAKLPEAEQDSLADRMFAKGATANLIEFTPKSVLPADGKGSEHMLSFDYAYKVKAVREWLFHQSK